MKKVKQISVRLENKPGNLALFCQRLEGSNIDIIAFSVVESALQYVVRLVVEDSLPVLKTLDEWCLEYHETDVLLFDLPDGNRALTELARKPTRKEISVNFTYMSKSLDGEKSYIVIGTPNIEATMRALRHVE